MIFGTFDGFHLTEAYRSRLAEATRYDAVRGVCTGLAGAVEKHVYQYCQFITHRC